jgi:hypothetical protein
MSAYAIFVYKGELQIAHGLDSAQQLVQRMTDAVASGEATGVLVKSVDNALPLVEGFQESQFWIEIANSIKTDDYNALTRDTLAGMFGIVAATLIAPFGPSAALLADYIASNMYTEIYDAISGGTATWRAEFLDYLERGGHFFPDYSVNPFANTCYRTSVATRPPTARDPLAIDLDGDGIETVGITGTPVLFDHNADNIKTGTGWVRPDDAWLVLDRNNNGLIDSGRELFGVDTVLSGTPGLDAVYASTGFEALKTLDSNGDNLFNAADAAFTQVKIWQDANQDGISQSTELFTLAQKNIASIALNATSTTTNLGNGNTVSGTAVVTRTNGSTTLIDAVSVTTDTTAANLFLGVNPFYRQFTDPITLTAQAQDLPQMQGSGWVRDLREAMSCGQALKAKKRRELRRKTGVSPRGICVSSYGNCSEYVDGCASFCRRSAVRSSAPFPLSSSTNLLKVTL